MELGVESKRVRYFSSDSLNLDSDDLSAFAACLRSAISRDTLSIIWFVTLLKDSNSSNCEAPDTLAVRSPVETLCNTSKCSARPMANS